VVNRVRASVVGGPPRPRIRAALARYASVDDPVLIPDDRAALDAAVLAGRPLTEAAPRSSPRRVLAQLAQRLADERSATPQQPRRRTRR
jgi:hypothetical protein